MIFERGLTSSSRGNKFPSGWSNHAYPTHWAARLPDAAAFGDQPRDEDRPGDNGSGITQEGCHDLLLEHQPACSPSMASPTCRSMASRLICSRSDGPRLMKQHGVTIDESWRPPPIPWIPASCGTRTAVLSAPAFR
jgi:hypothetical protein